MKDETIYQKELEDWQLNAEFYKKEISSPFFKELIRRKVSCYGREVFKDRIIADLGGGNGYFLNYIKKSCFYLGINLDFSLGMLESARQLFKANNCVFLNATVEEIPLKTDSIDVVILNGALHHFKASNILVSSVMETDRILKHDGYICLYDRNGSFASRAIHSLALFLKKFLQRCIGIFSSSSSSTEPDFGDTDLKLFLDKGYTIQKREFVSTVPFFFFLVFCNFIEYITNSCLAQGMRKFFIHLALPFERLISFKWFTIEQCVLLKKNK